MKAVEKSIMIEVLGGLEIFKSVYTMAEMRKMKCRYICTDMQSDVSVYEINKTGELIAVEG